MKQLTILLLLVTAMSACQSKKDSVRSAVTSVAGLNGVTGLSGVQCAQGSTNTLGAIYDASGNATFDARVKALLSATMTADEVGTVEATIGASTGIRFSGTMFLDASGNVVSARSKLNISVYDSIWLMNQAGGAIPLDFDPAQGAVLSGQFSPSTGQGFLLVKDQYGEIRFTGTINSSQFSGTVSFVNTANVNGGSPASGTLGQFMITSCGIVQK